MMTKTIQNNMIGTLRTALWVVFIGVCIILPSASWAAPTQDFPVVRLKSLDKVTARTMTFEVKVGSTVKFGPLFIKAQSCRKAPAIEQPESAAFLQIWEVDAQDVAHWIFSGWMFASSPALSPMDHPIYDVWVLDCLNEQGKGKEEDELKEEQVPSQPDDSNAQDKPSEKKRDEADSETQRNEDKLDADSDIRE